MTTGNLGFDAFVEAIADRVCAKLREQNEPEYLPAREVARRINLPLRSVYAKAAQGEIPSTRIGKRVMFRIGDVRKAMEAE